MVKVASMYPLETHLLRAETPQERQVLRREDKKLDGILDQTHDLEIMNPPR